MTDTAPSRAIVNLAAYAHNLEVVRRFVGPNVSIAAVVKANAYGHGLIPIAKRAAECQVRMLAVATVDEGVQLREAGITLPILITVQPNEAALAAAIEHDLTLTLSTASAAERLGELAHKRNRVVQVHCEVDTGMGRQGFALSTAAHDIQYLTRISHIDIEGVSMHFPVAEQRDDQFTFEQIKSFTHLLKQLDRRGIPYEVTHAANSAAIVNYQGSVFDMVRPGLMTYGVWPLNTTPSQDLLKPVLRWETRVVQVRELDPGASIGYGRTFISNTRMRTAILPVGYADGYKYSLSNRAEVIIQGVRCPVRGSVFMDQIVVDVSQAKEVQEGDVATLIGSDGTETISPGDLAVWANTIPYDILTGIGLRVPREYINEA